MNASTSTSKRIKTVGFNFKNMGKQKNNMVDNTIF